MLIDKETLTQFENRYRATFLNSLAGIKQAFLIGSKSNEGNSNLAIFNSLIHIGANPALWGFICRPDTVKRDTLYNILETKEYSINYIKIEDFKKAHQTSAKYKSEISEFESCGFTESYLKDFNAPFVAEAPVKIAMKFQERVDITINNTILLIGSIEHITIENDIISKDGFVALEMVNTLACAGLDAYYESRFIERLSYASTDKWPEKI